MSYRSMQLAARSLARSSDWAEPSLALPLTDELAELLTIRTKTPFSRPELARFRKLTSEAFDRAAGKHHGAK